MTRENLYDAITEVKDALVDEAAPAKPAGKRVSWLRFAAAAAALAVVIALGAGVGSWRSGGSSHGFGPIIGDPDSNMGGSQAAPGGGVAGHDEGTVFMSYAGPVFPLTALNGGEGLTAAREVTYDFAQWESLAWPYRTPVTDRYTIANGTGEDKTVTLLYPFASSLYDLMDDIPSLSLDGAGLDAALRAGGYTGGFQAVPGGESAGRFNLDPLNSWEQYWDLLSDGRYLEDALGGVHDLSDVPVTVYKFTNYWGPERDEKNGIPNPTIRAEFDLDYSKTTVLSYGFHGASLDPDAGHMMQSFSIPRDFDPEDGNPFYLIVLGEDIANLTTQGYATGGSTTKDTVEAGVDVERYAADLDSALRAAAELMYQGCPWWSEWDKEDWPDFELYFDLMKADLMSYGLIGNDPVERYDTGWLQENDLGGMERVFYLETAVTVPAGGSVTVEAAFTKAASFNFYCGSQEGERVYGYDLVTRLGTSLDFTQQTARTVNTGGVEIVRQNYGFDWEHGVDTVALDPAVERYYLEVRAAQMD